MSFSFMRAPAEGGLCAVNFSAETPAEGGLCAVNFSAETPAPRISSVVPTVVIP